MFIKKTQRNVGSIKLASFIIILLGLLNIYGLAEKVAVLPQIYKADDIAVDDTQIYVSQEFKVFIYSMRDYKLVKKFGTKGAGPREFRGFIEVVPWKDQLIITSSGKISFFSKRGEYQSETKSITPKNGIFVPLDNGFVGHGYVMTGRNAWKLTINLYNNKLEQVKEILRYGGSRKNNNSKQINLMSRSRRTFHIQNNKILINQPDGSIAIYDKRANLTTTIEGHYEKIKFTAQHQKALIDNLLLNTSGKMGSFKEWANRLAFPEFSPPIQLFQTSDQKVYVLTHKRIDQKGECFIYDLNGKLLKHTMLPIVDFSPKDPYPLAFYKGTLFQIFENEDSEEWELHINRII